MPHQLRQRFFAISHFCRSQIRIGIRELLKIASSEALYTLNQIDACFYLLIINLLHSLR